jgi:hypothetical protein
MNAMTDKPCLCPNSVDCCSSANRFWLLIKESNRSAGGIADQELGRAGVCKPRTEELKQSTVAITDQELGSVGDQKFLNSPPVLVHGVG